MLIIEVVLPLKWVCKPEPTAVVNVIIDNTGEQTEATRLFGLL